MPIKKKCTVCKKVFFVRPSRKNTSKFCSYGCKNKAQAKALKGKGNPFYGKHHSKESKRKNSITHKRVWKNPDSGYNSKEFREDLSKRMSGKNHPLYGKHHTAESKRKMSESQKGKIHSEESKKKLAEATKKLWKDPQYRKKVLKGMINAERPEGWAENISKALKGRKFSKETKEKLRQASLITSKKLWQDPKFRRKQLEGMRRPEVRKLISEANKGKLAGKKNPAYVDGMSKFPYPLGFNKAIKELIRKRDNYVCQLCGIKESKLTGQKKVLTAHHINYSPPDISEKNLIALCDICNKRVNANRDYWFAFFCYHLGIEPEEVVKNG